MTGQRLDHTATEGTITQSHNHTCVGLSLRPKSITQPTLEVRRAPMMCTSLPSFSGATLWMLSGDTTSDSPSAREVAVFSARPCQRVEGGISTAQALLDALLWAEREGPQPAERVRSGDCRVKPGTQDSCRPEPIPGRPCQSQSARSWEQLCVSLPCTGPVPPLASAFYSPSSQSMWLPKANLNYCPRHTIQDWPARCALSLADTSAVSPKGARSLWENPGWQGTFSSIS